MGDGMSEAYDVIVVGAGLAGLIAALHTQSQGLRTLVLERNAHAGGLCGTFELEGAEFVRACNDFGTGLMRELDALGVAIEFEHPLARFHFADGTIQLRPDLPTILRLGRRLPGIVAMFRAGRKVETLGALIDRAVADPLLADLACLPAFAMMRSPDDVSIRMLSEIMSKDLGYGYERSSVPVGGPGVLTQRLTERLAALGGTLELGVEQRGSRREDGLHHLQTTRGEYRARALISSEGRWDAYPEASRPGLRCAGYLASLRSTLPFPERVHTLDWFCRDVAGMLRRLEAGVPDDAPAFHLFRSKLPGSPEHYTVNVFVPVARGEEDLSPERRVALQAHLRRQLERLLPGFSGALRFDRLLSPREYEACAGVVPAPSPLVAPIGFDKPPIYDAERDVYFVGTSVGPPGEHAGAAVLSGRRAAQAVVVAAGRAQSRRFAENTRQWGRSR